LKCEGAKVPVIVLNRQQALEELWLKKFSTGFTGGQKIRITQTDRFVGITREQSTFGCSLWDGEGRTFPMARLQNLGVA
jgi:frataxin-like iron-binding protein CyaY